jgi:hypothetical protein
MANRIDGGGCDLDFRIAKLDLKPGDVLIVQSTTALTDAVLRSLGAMFQAVLPNDAKIMILEPGMTLAILHADKGYETVDVAADSEVAGALSGPERSGA